MQTRNRKDMFLGLVAGVGITALGAILMGQGASQPVKSATEYYVTGEGDDAHLWTREGAVLRCVGHGECTAHAHDKHDKNDHSDHGHEHEKPAPKK